MKLTVRGKIILGVIYTMSMLAMTYCMAVVVFCRDNPIWVLAFFCLMLLTFFVGYVMDYVERKEKERKILHEQSYFNGETH